MKVRNVIKLVTLSLAALVMATCLPSASAAVTGHLAFANCIGGGVTVTLTTIDFQLPPLGGNGCIATGLGTTIAFSGGTGVVTTAELGTVNDIGFPPPGSGNVGFITFPGVTFDLLAISPGVASIGCVNTFNPADPSCAIVAGSPFVVSPGSLGATIAFSVSGITNDTSTVHNPWIGTFSTQIVGVTPAALQTLITTNGSFTKTYSFDGQVVPEPVSMGLIGGGLIALAVFKRRKARA